MEEDGTGVLWTDKVWLSYFPLNDTTALDYFSLSQFYDRSCNNELVKMQRLDPALMSTMAGIEYKLLPSPSENLFLVSKSRRVTAPKPAVAVLAVYYILNGNVYQAPTAHAVLSSRVLQALHHLRNSFDVLQSHARPSPAPQSGAAKHWSPPAAAVYAPRRDLPPEAESDAGRHERRAIDRIMYDLLDKNRRIAAAAAANAALREREAAAESRPGPE
jgi:mediator of RNA polymerase II transcription subunit 6